MISDSIIYGMSRKKLYIPFSLCYASEGDFMGSKNEDNILLDKEFLDEKYNQGLLFDFYGELLTEHNKEIYADYIVNDLSLSEIASNRGISRQGIHDVIKRTTKKLYEYEQKLHLLKKYEAMQDKVDNIQVLVESIKETKELDDNTFKRLNEIDKLVKNMIDEI